MFGKTWIEAKLARARAESQLLQSAANQSRGGDELREIIIKKGDRQRILHLVFDSIPQRVKFRAEPMAPGTALNGTVDVVHSQWLFAKAPASRDLEPDNVIQKGF